MSREAKILSTILVVIVGGMVALFTMSGAGSGTVDTNTPKVDASKLVRDNSHKTGSGPVTVVEFGDYQCPACAQAAPEVAKLKENYKDKITFVYRHFPLQQHRNAMPAARAAEAASVQGKFWEMHDKLYAGQTSWQDLPDPKDVFARYAQDLGLDGDKFKSDLENPSAVDFINTDRTDGESIPVSSTPTIYVNGRAASSFGYDTLKDMVEAELKNQQQ